MSVNGMSCDRDTDSNPLELQLGPLVFFVNGKKVVENNPNPEWTLVYYLRNKLRLCGTKESCGEGGCGACTVLLSKVDQSNNSIMNLAINACLTPLCSVHGTAIITTEGIGSIRNGLHPVQERIAKSHGTQCGYCTPGFVMSMYCLLRNNSHPTEKELEDAFQGNLCRCTGYRPILDGFKTFCVKAIDGGCCMNKQNGGCCKDGENPQLQQISDVLFDESEFQPYDPSQDPIFPPELLQKKLSPKELSVFKSPAVTWYIARDLTDVLELKDKFHEAKIMAGNTEIGVDVKFKKCFYEKYIQISEVKELSQIRVEDNKLVIGGGVTLSNLKEFCKNNSKRRGHILHAIGEMLHWFAGQQVRNVATISGNIVTASPISDLNPILMAAGSIVTFSSKESSRDVKMDENFFIGYRKTPIRPNEILTSISIPMTDQNEYIGAFKQSRRRDDDIAIVNAGMRIRMNNCKGTIEEATLAFGGMQATTLIARSASTHLLEKEWKKQLVEDIANILMEELKLSGDAPGGMVEYRMSLASSFFLKFFLAVNEWKGNSSPEQTMNTVSRELSAVEPHTYQKTQGSQMYQIVPNDQAVHDLIGRPVVHMSGLKHATGEAAYTDDTPPQQGELHVGFVLSDIAHGKLLKVDPSKALKVPGVVEFLDSHCLPNERNKFGPVVSDEDIFAIDEVTCQGQIIGIIVATDQFTAEKAAKLVKVEYEKLKPIVTIEEAIEEGSFLSKELNISCGNTEQAFGTCDNVLEGELRIGGQQHFYLETQSAIATPKEDGEMDILVSTQGPSYNQRCVAKSLGVPLNRVRIRCRRMGGAFGGKESRAAIPALITAIAAQKLGVSVRCVMNRSDDMNLIGGRHPFLCKYKVGFSNTGDIQAVKVNLFANGGNSADASVPVLEKSLFAIDNAYTFPNCDISGRVCRTNLPSNTAFRGFGSPQGALFIENIIDMVAETLKIESFEIRQKHLKSEGDKAPCGFEMKDCTIRRCWSECVENSLYFERKLEVEKFNNENRWKKRGISVMPTLHYLGFPTNFLNQAAALVLVYTDGSVFLNHGGTEMGQGLHTKMLQVASKALDIPIEKIHFSETSTDKIPNTTATCASMSSDLNGGAVLNACEKLLKRLEPFKKANPTGNWDDWVNAAYFNKVSLSATGFYGIDLNYEFGEKVQKKDPFHYTSFGVACSEVEIDCLTGDHLVLRTDIVMDVGESLNPAVDIGQIEGAFIQGYGLFTIEENVFSPEGRLLTKGPGMYKIPSVNDIPREFNVSLLRGAPNPRAVYSSKGIGEPPLFLAASIFLAIKDAIKSGRKEMGVSPVFRLDSPATSERIVLACKNIIISNCDDKKNKKWSTVV